jgi:hypothetical protein
MLIVSVEVKGESIKVKEGELGKKFRENVAAFDVGYKGKLIETRGVISKIGSKVMEVGGVEKEVYVVLLDNEECNLMYVFEEAQKLVDLKPQDKVEIEGLCEYRHLKNVYFTSSRIISVNNKKVEANKGEETKEIGIRQNDNLARLLKLSEKNVKEATAIKDEIRAAEHRKIKKEKAKTGRQHV